MNLFPLFRNVLMYLALSVGTFLMTRTILGYCSFDTHAGFLQAKQDYIHIPIWITAFYVHVFSSIFILIAGFFQFSNYILHHHRRLHRFIGKMYAWNIFLINFPAGFIMAIYANGHWPSKLAFLILDCLWFFFTLKAVIAIKNKKVREHKEFVIRSYALTCSALTLRTWKLILTATTGLDPGLIYMIDAWLGFVPNLLFAEWLIRRMRNK